MFKSILFLILFHLVIGDQEQGDPPVPKTSAQYERCKATHRCVQGYSWYDVASQTHTFRSTAYQGGLYSEAGVFSDFEDWLPGTHGWGGFEEKQTSSNFHSIDFPLLGVLDVEVEGYKIAFNTDNFTCVVTDDNDIVQDTFIGSLNETEMGTEVVVYNFDYIKISRNISVTFEGQRAIALLSRSSVKIASPLIVRPATLGGFPGCKDIGENNINGPGSSSTRVYLFTVVTDGKDVDEVQTISTSARPGQTLKGSFRLKFRGGETHSIPHDASPQLFKAKLERSSKNIGRVRVTRSKPTNEGGYTWTVTFETAVGDLPQLEVSKNDLLGIDNAVVVQTIQDGNSIHGSFKLNFLGLQSPSIPSNATSWEMRKLLKQAFYPKVKTIYVQRSDRSSDNNNYQSFGPCDHGLCEDGPGQAKGLVWTLTLTTNEGNVVPMYPTSGLVNATGVEEEMTSTQRDLLFGLDANVSVLRGHKILKHAHTFTTHENENLNVFSLCYGGLGASHETIGHTQEFDKAVLTTQYIEPFLREFINTPEEYLEEIKMHTGNPYSNIKIEGDLLGGSGGAIGGMSIRQILSHYPPAGIGGDGGGAIEIVAENDIILQDGSEINTSGGNGQDAFHGGGGGSGGSILISAGGTVWIQKEAKITSNGGRGGKSYSLNKSTSDGSNGRIAIYGQSIRIENEYINENIMKTKSNFHVETNLGPSFTIDPNHGAASTQSSLKLTVEESIETGSGVRKNRPIVRNGPVFKLADISSSSTGRPPNRVSFFLKISDENKLGSVRNNWNGYVALHDKDKTKEETMIGVGNIDGNFCYGSNFIYSPTNKFFWGVEQMQWYKFDILIYWDMKTYDIRVNDIEYVIDSPFEGEEIESIGLYGFHASTVWFDEIFVGRDDAMMFRCPKIKEKQKTDNPNQNSRTRKSSATVEMKRPMQSDWKSEWLGDESITSEMTRHNSHLSEREYYQSSEVSGIDFFSGGVHKRFRSEVGIRETGPMEGAFNSGILLHTPSYPGHKVGDEILGRSKSTANDEHGGWENGNQDSSFSTTTASTGRYYWYGEHQNPDILKEDYLLGGVMACSTTDFIHWRNEGTMLHYANISYTGGVPRLFVNVHGGTDGVGTNTAGNHHRVEILVEELTREGDWLNEPLVAERPKVLFNNSTKKYVMWSEVHDASNELGVTLVAQSDHPGGPFELNDVFLPDGNQTHDQTIIQQQDGTALLVRTYYSTVDYVLPEPVMQPLWESVKGEDNSIDFGLNYHRSMYKVEYDDSNDICIQRLRKEDVAAEIEYLNSTVKQSEWIRNTYSGEGILEDFIVTEQSEPWITRNIIGQGEPVVKSRFKNPSDPQNNVWMPNSVPTVKAQQWKYNYLDGNIADNKVHATLPDKLIGPPQIVEQRRTKYIAVSRLSDDYLTTAGVMSIYEGYLESGQDLASVLNDRNKFSFQADPEPTNQQKRVFFPDKCDGGLYDNEWEDCNQAILHHVESTAPGQIWGLNEPFNFITEYDWSWRYHQYRWANNDLQSRPVNFYDQIVDWFVPGRGESRTAQARVFIREYDHNCFRGPNEYNEDDPKYIPADKLFNHTLSQHYLKTENADINSTRAHLLDL